MRNRLASESARSSPRLRRPPRLAIISTALLVVTILALGLRLFRLTNSDLWGDEAYSVWLSQHDLLTIFGALSQGEPHPPFYPVLLWLWMKAAGSSEFAVRLPSAILGALMVPLAARWGTRLVGPGVGLVAALLVAFNPFLVWYSQETRMYIAAALFAAWSVLALDNAIAGRQGFRWYVLATALLIYTHYYGLFVWGAEVLVLAWLSWRGYIAGRRWLGPLALVGLLYLPWVAFSTHIFFSYYGVAPGRVDLTGILLGFWQHAPAGMTLSGRQATAIASAYTALALLGAGCLWWRARRSPHLMSSFPLVAAWLVVPLLGGMAVSLVRPMYAERYLIVSAMPLILLAAAGIGSIRWPRPGQPAFTRIVSGAAQGALTIAMLAGAVYALQPYYFDARFLKSQYSAHAHQVEALSRPGDAVLLDGHSQVFLQRYYYHGELPEYLMPVGVPIDEAATAAKLGEIAATHTGAWLYLYATSDYDPANFVERWLDEHAYRAWHTWTVNGRLLYYAFYPPEKLAASPLDVGFGPAVHLGEIASVNVGSSPLTAGQVLPLRLRWSAGEATGLKVSARLRDADGFLWGSTDQEALRGVATGRGTIEDHLGLLVQPGTPPGEYRLELRLYAAADGKALAPTLAGAASTARPTALAPHVDGDALVFSGLRVEQPSIGQGLPLPGLSRGGQRFGELTLLSYGLPSEATAGQKAYLTFIWRAAEQPAADYRLVVTLGGERGEPVFQRELPLTNAEFPTSRWERGALLRGQYNLAIDPRLPGGSYRWTVALRPGSDAALATGAVELGRVTMAPRPALQPTSQPQHTMDTGFGDLVRLSGYSLSDERASPGGTLGLTLYWTPLNDIGEGYSMFVHVVDAGGKLVAQRDSVPCDGKCPTTSWVPGDTIEDHYEISLPKELPPGQYQIVVGLYLPVSGQRLPVAGAGEDSVTLPKHLTVK